MPTARRTCDGNASMWERYLDVNVPLPRLIFSTANVGDPTHGIEVNVESTKEQTAKIARLNRSRLLALKKRNRLLASKEHNLRSNKGKTKNELKNRMQIFNEYNELPDPAIVDGLIKMFDQHNKVVQSFRMARDIFKEDEMIDVCLRLINSRQSDGRQYNLPTGNEVATLIKGDGFNVNDFRDIIVGGLERINELHPKFMALQYPLMFPRGEDGYRPWIPYRRFPNSEENERVFNIDDHKRDTKIKECVGKTIN
ncbi:hypothetical protein IFM89_034779 [Coptis chinensis]|uniref:Uncharacterized protein n=1 Tax=Coptis chinensis TaxID=261450 RepID=A0A835H7N9_9MAGN|nr:hypothetical protein IFM89_034779 [Coptis chinensis]